MYIHSLKCKQAGTWELPLDQALVNLTSNCSFLEQLIEQILEVLLDHSLVNKDGTWNMFAKANLSYGGFNKHQVWAMSPSQALSFSLHFPKAAQHGSGHSTAKAPLGSDSKLLQYRIFSVLYMENSTCTACCRDFTVVKFRYWASTENRSSPALAEPNQPPDFYFHWRQIQFFTFHFQRNI